MDANDLATRVEADVEVVTSLQAVLFKKASGLYDEIAWLVLLQAQLPEEKHVALCSFVSAV
ncbi:hypothetical protein PPTG_16408 [Phytophthora nicotianae INRA-310]|uniref:Uncharacterized protein n=1 Tax=Phytophthora nicotianae (strain INRA-310) TaxID=761204 RepID=W2PN87_PHYN3|nr:hypothetical protein PPTG_16408 [Phytophthora nicotianae INRA-310]ETN02453.1 hypothetical protein PPTG_16408 [Phytophthora nicotianae INRA-310]